MTIKKVLFQLNQVGFGGTEKSILSFVENIDRSEFEPYLFVHEVRGGMRYWRHRIAALFSEKARLRFKSFYVDHYSREDKFNSVFGADHVFYGGVEQLKVALDKVQPDILHISRGEFRDFYTDLIENFPKGSTFIIESSIFGKSAPEKYLSRTDRFVFISHWLMSQQDWAGDKAKVVYLPINPQQTQENLRAELGISQDDLVIGHAQRPDLGNDNFLEKVYTPILRAKKHPIKLLGLGHRNFYSPAFIQEFGELVVNLAPTTDEIRLSKFYNTIDVLTHRRIEGETFGMINAEAMIHGKPVITHRSHIDNAQVEILGDEYWVADFSDEETYRNRLNELLDSKELRERVGQKNRKRAERNFSAAKVTRDWEKEYRDLL